jgi:phage terminase large subunit-like protein
MNPIDAYAAAVVTGDVPAGKYHRLACVRHQRDRARENTPAFPFRFDMAKADRFFRFVGLLKHYKGEWAGQPIELQPYQLFRLGSIFGWVHVVTGLRRFRTSYHEIPRKNGKSLEAAVVALYLTFFDGEAGAEGYTIATKRDQARIVWGDARQLVLSSGLKERIAVQVANLHVDATASKLEPLGADHDSTDGLNPSLIIVDEFHAHKTRGLIDVMETATGARRQPHNFQITTAGDDPISPGGDQHDYACKILDNVLVDESFFAFIAHADLEDDWQDEATWRKANPNYGVSVNPEDIRGLALKAKSMPAAAATFKQKRLNLWVNATAPCLSVEGWRAGQSVLPHAPWRDALLHERCYIGIDLASKIDLCALSLVFPPTETRTRWRVIQHIWTPEETVKDRSHRDRAPYDIWVAQGWLTTTPGSRIDHAVVRQAIVSARVLYQVELIGFDPWHADTLIDELVREEGFAADRVLAVPQTYQGMSSACLRMQAEILEGNIDAGGCPVTAWSVSNAVANRDGKDNLMFAKGKSRGRIDPLIAMTIGMALWLRLPAVVEPTYGILVLGGRHA